MMYFRQVNPLGCLLWTILFIWLFVKLKLYYLVAIFILVALAYNFLNGAKAHIKEHKEQKERDFEPEIGEVYKICPFCGNSIKRSAKTCPHCQNQIK